MQTIESKQSQESVNTINNELQTSQNFSSSSSNSLTKEIQKEALEDNVEYLKFDVKNAELTEAISRGRDDRNFLMYKALQKLKEEKAKTKIFNIDNFFSESQIVLNSLKWYKNNLVKAHSINQLNKKLIKRLINKKNENSQKIANFDNKMSKTTLLLNESQNKIKMQEKMLESNKSKIKALENEIKTQIQSQKESNIKFETMQKTLTAAIEESKLQNSKKLKAKDTLLSNLHDKTNSILMDYKAKYEEEKKTAAKSNSALKAEIERASSDKQMLISLNSNMKTTLKKIDQIKAKNKKNKEKSAHLAEENAELKIQVSQKTLEANIERERHFSSKKELEMRMKRMEGLFNKVENLTTELAEQKAAKKGLNRELEDTKKTLEELSHSRKSQGQGQRKLEESFKKLKEENIRLKNSKDALEEKTAKLKKDNLEIKRYFSKGKIRGKQSDEDFSLEGFLKAEVERLKQKIANFESENNSLKNQLDENTNNFKINSKTGTNALRESNKKLKQKVIDLKAKISTQEALLNEKKKQNTAMEKEQKQIKNELKEMKAKNKKLEEKCLNFKNINSDKMKKIKELKNDVKSKTKENENKTAKIKNIDQSLKIKNKKLTDLAANSSRLTSWIDSELENFRNTLDKNIYNKNRRNSNFSEISESTDINNIDFTKEFNFGKKRKIDEKNAKIDEKNGKNDKKTKNNKKEKNDQNEENENYTGRNLTLRERIEMSKNL